MSANVWRVIALGCLTVAIAFVAFGTLLEHAPDDFGIAYHLNSNGASITVVHVERGSSAQLANIRPGERIALPSSPNQVANLLYPSVGTRATIRIKGEHSVTLVERSSNRASLPIPLTLIRLAFLIVAALLAWRRPGDRCVRWLAGFLGCYGLGIALSNNALPTPMLSLIFLQIGGISLLIVGTGAAARFAATFPSGREPPAARALSLAALAVAALTVLWIAILSLTPAHIVASVAVARGIGFAGILCVFPLALATLIAAYIQGAAINRPRRKWIFAIIIVGLLGPLVDIGVISMHGLVPLVDEFSILPLTIIPIGLAYVILRHRVIDIGFILNRAVVYAGVSIIIVGIFVLLESILARSLESQSHATGLAAQLIVALALGFSIRFVHARVDRFVDLVLFRERHRAETAMRDFAHDAIYISDEDTLLRQCIEIVTHYAYATSAGIWIRNEDGRYRKAEGTLEPAVMVDENDPAILAMRARRAVVTLPDARSSLPGLLAFPMIVRGELVGTLLCAPKIGGEAYAPDERDALEAIATAVGHASDALAVAELKRRLEQLLRPATAS